MTGPPYITSAPLAALLTGAKAGAAPRHGFFGREGGVSGGIYAGLNCGLGSNDDRESVLENRRRAVDALRPGAGAGPVPDSLLTLHQHHSNHVVTAKTPWAPADAPKADACVTRTPGLAVSVLTADCAPVLLADAEAGVIGAAHAGWRGALAGVIENTVAAMAALGARPENMCAAVGPCIRQPSYQVGEDMFQAFMQAGADAAGYFIPDDKDPSRRRFDLPGFAASRLRRAGVGAVDDVGVDTYTDETRFFSCRRAAHRGEADYGRMISVIVLPGGG